MFAGKRPPNLGVHHGKLLPCPGTPNCVCSTDNDAEHTIAPIAYHTSSAEAMKKLKDVIGTIGKTNIVTESEDYLYVEFTSKLMGFVDDVEFYFDPLNQVIQVRSASRLGKSDLGVNRKRIETIREKLATVGA